MSNPTEASQKRRPRMRIFRADESIPVDENMMPMKGIDEAVRAGFAQVAGHGLENAHRVQCLFQEASGSGLSLLHIWYKSGFVLPEHRHDADCVYYIIAGEIHTGSVVLGQGDGFYIPKGHDYTYTVGPEGVELLEFRNAATFNIEFSNKNPNQWLRMIAAADANAAAWKEQTKPPLRR